MKLYTSLDASRFFALPDDCALPPGDSVVRRLMAPPEHADLEALAQWEVSRDEGLELAKTVLDTSAMGRFEQHLLDLQRDLRKPETQKGLRKVAEGLKRIGEAARERRRARKARKGDA